MTGLNNRPVTERNEMTDSHESPKDRGSVAVIAALVFVPLALMLALVVDAGAPG
jgi:hypothetical protein